jgi:hypothetical protein
MKDSNGNELPKNIWLPSDATQEMIGKALTVNSFLLAVKVNIKKGKKVAYDQESKSATITDEQGRTMFISHN